LAQAGGNVQPAVQTRPANPWMDEFWVRRLQSLLGLVPIGAFLLFHLYVNLLATQGPQEYNTLINSLEHVPLLIFIEVFVLYLPILFHAGVGFYIVFSPELNITRYPYGRNWNFYLQRVTGVIAFIFLAYHIVTLRLIPGMNDSHVTFALVQEQLRTPWILVLYLVGVIGTIYHFSNGLWSFAVHWGLTVGKRSQRIMSYVSAGVFVVLTLVVIRIVFAFV
jgi:succinate dehydrogenase / fumarate reductase cytochrome b subunit